MRVLTVSQSTSQWLRRQRGGGSSDTIDCAGSVGSQSDGCVWTVRRRHHRLSALSWAAVDQTPSNLLELAGPRVVRQLASTTRLRVLAGRQSDHIDLRVGSRRRTARERGRAWRCRIRVASRHHCQWRQSYRRQRRLAVCTAQGVVMFLHQTAVTVCIAQRVVMFLHQTAVTAYSLHTAKMMTLLTTHNPSTRGLYMPICKVELSGGWKNFGQTLWRHRRFTRVTMTVGLKNKSYQIKVHHLSYQTTAAPSS